MTYEITYFHIISLIYNDYFVKLSISLQDLGTTLKTIGVYTTIMRIKATTIG